MVITARPGDKDKRFLSANGGNFALTMQDDVREIVLPTEGSMCENARMEIALGDYSFARSHMVTNLNDLDVRLRSRKEEKGYQTFQNGESI